MFENIYRKRQLLLVIVLLQIIFPIHSFNSNFKKNEKKLTLDFDRKFKVVEDLYNKKSDDLALEYGLDLYSNIHQKLDLNKESKLTRIIGGIYSQKKNYLDAKKYFLKSIKKVPNKNNIYAESTSELGVIYYNLEEPDSSLYYLKESLNTATSLKDSSLIAQDKHRLAVLYIKQSKIKDAIVSIVSAINYYKNHPGQKELVGSKIVLAGCYQGISDYEKAIKVYLDALEIADKYKLNNKKLKILNNLGITYLYLKNYDKALELFNKSLKLKEVSEKNLEASTLHNIGIIYKKKHNFDKAIEYYGKALKMRMEENNNLKIAVNYLDLGNVYREKKNVKKALKYFNKAKEINKSVKNTTLEISILNNLALVYSYQKKYSLANKYINQALELCEKGNSRKMESTTYKVASYIFEDSKNYNKALEYFKRFNKINNELFSLRKSKQIANMQIKYETEKIQNENKVLKAKEILKNEIVKRTKTLNISLIIFLILFFIIVLILIQKYIVINRTKIIIEKEKNKMIHLIKNILPENVAEEIIAHNNYRARKFPKTAVLLTDFVDFTKISANVSPEIIIQELNELYSSFDLIAKKYNTERIKTLGDAYLAVNGISSSKPCSLENTINCGLEIIEYLKIRNRDSHIKWKIRISVLSGEIIGGIVGLDKYLFDVFGDTINLSFRLNSVSYPMQLIVLEEDMEKIKDQFICDYIGSFLLKGKGYHKLYSVKKQDL